MMHFWIDILFVLFFAMINGSYAILVALSILDILQRRATRMPEFDSIVLSEESTPPISILAPAYNEEAGIEDSVRSFLQLVYPSLQVIVIDDGSTDGTLARLTEKFQLRPIRMVVRQDVPTQPVKAIFQSTRDRRLWVIAKENGGKADALNVGINFCRTPLLCCLDADTIIDRRALLRMVELFLYDEQQVVAVGGTVRVANGCTVKDGLVDATDLPRSWLARFQIVEYLRAFLFGRMGFNRLGGNLIISGAFGLFLREAIVDAGGYRQDTVGEDIDLVVRLHRTNLETGQPYKIVHIPDPVCFTEVPESIAVLSRQRDRWQRGLVDTLIAHRSMLFNYRYGRIGLIVFPFFVLFELLGPLIELGGYGWFLYCIFFGDIDASLVILYFLSAFFLGFLLSVQSLILDDLHTSFFRSTRQRMLLIAVAFLENFGYRQMTLFFRLKGIYRFLLGARSWGKMSKKGFTKAPLQETTLDA